jgi:hypothetical protein
LNFERNIRKIKKMIDQIGRRTLREYLNIVVAPGQLRREALDAVPITATESLARGGLRYVNALLVEGILALGAGIGVCLVAVLVRAGW